MGNINEVLQLLSELEAKQIRLSAIKAKYQAA